MRSPERFAVLFLFALSTLPVFSLGNKYSKKSNDEFSNKEAYKKEYKKDFDKREYKQKDYDMKKKEYDGRKRENDAGHNENKFYNDHSQFVDQNADLRKIDKPFRMAKLNLLWTKAQSRLTEPKLKSIFSELKIQDKEELALKKLKHEGNDKEGLLEAELRQKLLTIMKNYGLTEHVTEIQDKSKHKQDGGSYTVIELFTDKKLNKLWQQAEHSGFTAEELQMLKEEFTHHQQKVDQYNQILNQVGDASKNNAINSVDEKHDRFNELDQLENDDPVVHQYLNKVNELREKHKELREDYDRIYRMAMGGPKSQEFTEPRIQGLWRMALTSNFKPDELESLRSELFHYERRLMKLRRLHVEAAMEDEQRKNSGIDKIEGLDFTSDLIKKQTRKVAKMHLDIESKIMERHTEL
ncbi:alpha-2-macroglobulin receptor-associated protein [Cimex lectularius]|uniref:Alpha-2-macroglobulin receptor-associated protein n=1 Tax=Cimex lectularius TaxID=79782 RepID=A0A8I6R6K2_CIMLE|nr:alpha-2-macroglobulin receptor-associated protein [Cimex lectularius]XP_014239369.1 alpha-2-macroglobulin receptor-associated protein [Cimex lectularius]XP_014239371.1 alpha-2-macroglobulin receptor-associated protein [Cimex lectularius]